MTLLLVERRIEQGIFLFQDGLFDHCSLRPVIPHWAGNVSKKLWVHCVRCSLHLYWPGKFDFLKFLAPFFANILTGPFCPSSLPPDLFFNFLFAPLFPWPPPLENCWIWMNKQLKEENNASIPMLEEPFKKLCKDKMGDCEYLESLVSSMLRRMADMIEKDGSMTKY